MKPRQRYLVFLGISVLLGATGSYVISLWPFPRGLRSSPAAAEHGRPGPPSQSSELLGRYFQGDGTTTIYLTLSSNGAYSANWEADVGPCGKSVGNWSLQDSKVILSPSSETGMMKSYLRELDVYRFRTNWILVAAADRKSYEEFGILTGSPLFHYRRDETK